ncbi:MAG: hypothetical protein ACYDH9_23685, partial [Limisphaerales bacterium]
SKNSKSHFTPKADETLENQQGTSRLFPLWDGCEKMRIPILHPASFSALKVIVWLGRVANGIKSVLALTSVPIGQQMPT